jgi:hypothetical protein
MTELLREEFVDRQDKSRKEFNGVPNDPIRVSFYDYDGTRVNEVTRSEANKIAKADPSILFYFQDKNRIQQELTIGQVNVLVPSSDLATSSPCDTGAKPCGPPTLNIFGGEGLGALVNPVISPISEAPIAFDIINGGKNYTTPPFAQLVDKCGKGSGNKLETQISNGSVTQIKIKAPGDGYLAAPDGSYGGGGRVVVPAPDPNDPTPPKLPIVTFTASKYIINSDEEVTLVWRTENVTTVNITEVGNNLALIGSQNIRINRTKTYTLTAVGPGGMIKSQVTISLIPAQVPDPTKPPSVIFTSSKYEVNIDEEFELFWQVTSANTVEIVNEIGIVNNTGTRVLTIGETTTYTLTATGSGGTTIQKVTVVYKAPVVQPPLPPPPPPILGPTYPVILEIEDIDINNPGFGYQPGDKIVVTPDRGAVLEPVIDNGRIIKINVISPGSGFDDFPVITTNSPTGYNLSARPIFRVKRLDEEQNFVPPLGATIISVVDCVGIVPPKKEFDRVPR